MNGQQGSPGQSAQCAAGVVPVFASFSLFSNLLGASLFIEAKGKFSCQNARITENCAPATANDELIEVPFIQTGREFFF
ncbi:MAG: hypothetical protein Q6K90_07135, partial [Gloeomargarita sp. HHBFW_bins_162]